MMNIKNKNIVKIHMALIFAALFFISIISAADEKPATEPAPETAKETAKAAPNIDKSPKKVKEATVEKTEPVTTPDPAETSESEPKSVDNTEAAAPVEEAKPVDPSVNTEAEIPSDSVDDEQPVDEQSADEQPADEKSAEEPVKQEEKTTAVLETGDDTSVKKDNSDNSDSAKSEDENENLPTRHMFIIAYSMAVPFGATKDFADAFSGRGMGFEYRFHITPSIAAGVLFDWQSFEKKESGTSVKGNITIDGTRINVLESMPIAVSFVYNIKPVNSKVVPFAGLDIGAYKLWKSINYGWTSFTDDEWHFGLAPKLGVIFSLAKIPVYLAAKFNVLTRTKKYDDNYYLGIQLGIALKR